MNAGAPSRAQSWTAASYDTHGRFVSDLAGEVMCWLAPKTGERILDLGCGDGVLTAAIAAAGAEVVGVDTDAEMLAAAAKRGLDARQMSGEALTFENEFDAVFSNAALHWMMDAEAVLHGVSRALKPGGRFVAEMAGHGNLAAIITALRAIARARGGNEQLAGPWFYPSPAVYQPMLEQAGLAVRRMVLAPRQTPLKTGLRGWLPVFRKPFFDQYGPEAEAVLDEAEYLLRPVLCDGLAQWSADYVRLRFEAVKT